LVYQDDAGPLGDQVADLAQLVVGIAAGVADLHEQAPLVGDLDDTGRDLGEVGVVDLVHHKADGRAGPAGERPGERVGDVAELRRDLAHAARHRLADPAAAGEGAGGGGQRHAGALGDVGEAPPQPGLGHRAPSILIRVLPVAPPTA
jgi:hypothetical protein